MTKRTVQFKIYRYDPDKDEKPYMQDISVELEASDKKLLDAGKIGYFAFPPVKAGGVGHPFAGGSNVAIGAKTRFPDKAEAALKLIFAKEFQEFFATEGGWVPGNLKYGAAQAEAHEIKGTPTVEINGKRLDIADINTELPKVLP